MTTISVCACCGVESDDPRPSPTWWHLSNYFGLSGTFCPTCYDKVSHNSYKEPNRPEEYLAIFLKMGK